MAQKTISWCFPPRDEHFQNCNVTTCHLAVSYVISGTTTQISKVSEFEMWHTIESSLNPIFLTKKFLPAISCRSSGRSIKLWQYQSTAIFSPGSGVIITGSTTSPHTETIPMKYERGSRSTSFFSSRACRAISYTFPTKKLKNVLHLRRK